MQLAQDFHIWFNFLVWWSLTICGTYVKLKLEQKGLLQNSVNIFRSPWGKSYRKEVKNTVFTIIHHFQNIQFKIIA